MNGFKYKFELQRQIQYFRLRDNDSLLLKMFDFNILIYSPMGISHCAVYELLKEWKALESRIFNKSVFTTMDIRLCALYGF